MPRYYLDIHDGERDTRDDEGVELADRKAARNEAIGVLPDIARDVLPDGDYRTFEVKVREEDGRYFLQARLVLEAKWLD